MGFPSTIPDFEVDDLTSLFDEISVPCDGLKPSGMAVGERVHCDNLSLIHI